VIAIITCQTSPGDAYLSSFFKAAAISFATFAERAAAADLIPAQITKKQK
jgi:hypothetical protein